MIRVLLLLCYPSISVADCSYVAHFVWALACQTKGALKC